MFFSSRAASSCMLLELRPTISTPLSILSPGFFSTGWEFSFAARICQKYDRFPSCRVVFSTSHMLSPARIVFSPNVRFNAISYFYFLTVRPPGKYVHKMATKNITAGKMSRAIAPFHCNTSGASHSCTFFHPCQHSFAGDGWGGLAACTLRFGLCSLRQIPHGSFKV